MLRQDKRFLVMEGEIGVHHEQKFQNCVDEQWTRRIACYDLWLDIDWK